MGYSSSNGALLRAIAARYIQRPGYPAGTTQDDFNFVSLSAHLNPSDQPGNYKNHRIGVLHTVAGGVGPSGEFIAPDTAEFYPSTLTATNGKTAFGAVSVTVGPLVANRLYHLWTDQVAWILFGTANPTVATANGYPVMPYTVYPFVTTATYLYFGIIRDTVNGSVYVGWTGAKP